jgi:hypothetical protein
METSSEFAYKRGLPTQINNVKLCCFCRFISTCLRSRLTGNLGTGTHVCGSRVYQASVLLPRVQSLGKAFALAFCMMCHRNPTLSSITVGGRARPEMAST